MPAVPVPSAKGSAAAEETPGEDGRVLEDFQRLVAWRFLMLLDLKFSVEQATALVQDRNFDWHRAEYLIHKGASHQFVMDEMVQN